MLIHRPRTALAAPESRRNADAGWSGFDPNAYWLARYRTLGPADRAVVQAVAEFLSAHFTTTRAGQAGLLRGLDIGSAGNLYPALALLPWSGRITLGDVTPEGIDWLHRAAAGLGLDDEDGVWAWQQFWTEFARFPGYQQLANPRRLLAARHRVVRQNVLDLPPASWDIGTMFFVAESRTADPAEVRLATESFLRALVPGAPFAAAFRTTADAIETVIAACSTDFRILEIADDRPSADSPTILLALGTLS